MRSLRCAALGRDRSPPDPQTIKRPQMSASAAMSACPFGPYLLHMPSPQRSQHRRVPSLLAGNVEHVQAWWCVAHLRPEHGGARPDDHVDRPKPTPDQQKWPAQRWACRPWAHSSCPANRSRPVHADITRRRSRCRCPPTISSMPQRQRKKGAPAPLNQRYSTCDLLCKGDFPLAVNFEFCEALKSAKLTRQVRFIAAPRCSGAAQS